MLVASLDEIARRLKGRIVRDQIVFPTPNHPLRDRDSSLKLDPTAPNGFIVHCHNGDWKIVRDHVCREFGIDWTPRSNFIDYRERRRQRDREYQRKKREAAGARPHSQSLSAEARALNISRGKLRRMKQQVKRLPDGGNDRSGSVL